MNTQTTHSSLPEEWVRWLAGAADRRTGGPVPADDPAEILRRVAALASTVDNDRRVWLDCPTCRLDNGPYTPAEAGQLAGVHDDLHHRGHPTALLAVEVTG
jgi:hypothetical protein